MIIISLVKIEVEIKVMKIIEIEGIGDKYAKKLEESGIKEVEDLEKLSWEELEELAEKSGISLVLLDKWQEHADLMVEIDGVGPEYAEALNKVGIDSMKELAYRNPENTLERIETLDKEQPDVIRKLPTLDQIKDWIGQAKDKLGIIDEKRGSGTKLIKIEGIGDEYAKDLKKAGFETCEQLISLSKDELEELAEKSGISQKLLDKWQEHADLMRIKGIGPEYADALNRVGIDSVKEFAQRNPENTLERIETLDKEQPDVIRRLPVLDEIKDWINQAKEIK
ncbi:MAG: DUF4332 domain-containing protein [Candidatus Lokiarchaeota archaeon]|nr:DUF4332 domain-containing protein [Candidatus Lokiarchaeota archaeon]MBD3200544.1 DUF4332 domain-containing protein [Candidatus Lokiarchaeota archaeon]